MYRVAGGDPDTRHNLYRRRYETPEYFAVSWLYGPGASTPGIRSPPAASGRFHKNPLPRRALSAIIGSTNKTE